MGDAAKDLGRVRPAKDLVRQVGRDRDETAKDLGRVRLGQVWSAGNNIVRSSKAAKDIGRVRPAKDVGRQAGRDREKIAKDLGQVRPGQVWLGGVHWKGSRGNIMQGGGGLLDAVGVAVATGMFFKG